MVKLIYKDVYKIVDLNMSDSNVGSRKKRSHRNNLYIVYAIINNVLKVLNPSAFSHIGTTIVIKVINNPTFELIIPFRRNMPH